MTGEFQPMRLTLARWHRAIIASDLAINLGLAPQTISHYENGRVLPSPAHIRQFSQALHMPERWFYRPLRHEVPRMEDLHYAARSRVGMDLRRATLAQMSLFSELMALYDDACELPPLRMPRFLPDMDPALAADEIRTALGANRGPIYGLLAALERLGAHICRLSPESPDIGGCSAWVDGRPIIFLPGSIACPYALRVLAAQQLGRLLLFERPDYKQTVPSRSFALHLLMPEETYKRQTYASTRPVDYRRDADYWQVPIPDLIDHSLALGVLTQPEWKSAQVQMTQQKTRYTPHIGPWETPGMLQNLWQKTRKVLDWDLTHLCTELGVASDLLDGLLWDVTTQPPIPFPTGPARERGGQKHLKVLTGDA